MVSISCRSAAVRLSLLASFMGLAACGGGGGGGGDSTGGGVTAPGGIVTPASVTMTQAQTLVGRVANVVGQSAGATQISQQLYTLATTTTAASGSEACPLGGSVSYSRDDADRNNVVSTGDQVAMVGLNCRLPFSATAITLDGRVEAQVLLASGSLFYQPGMIWNLRTRQTYTSLTSSLSNQSVRINGALEIDDSQTGSTYRFANYVVSSLTSQIALQLTSGDLFVVNTFSNIGTADPTRRTAQFNNVVIQTNLTATEKVNITVPAASAPQLRFNDLGQVIGGTLVVQLDKAKLTVTVTAPDQVRLDVDNNSDGSVDATQTLAWSALLAAGVL